VSKEKLKISSWRIHSIKNCQKQIKNEKDMDLQNMLGQKVEKVPHPTLGNHFKKPKRSLFNVALLLLESQDEL
jgi:hypothetical protein